VTLTCASLGLHCRKVEIVCDSRSIARLRNFVYILVIKVLTRREIKQSFSLTSKSYFPNNKIYKKLSSLCHCIFNNALTI